MLAVFSFFPTGEASRKWDNLKKKYNRKKNNLKKKSASGAGLADVESCIKDLKEYSFLSWLDQHSALRESKTNIADTDNDDYDSEHEDSEKEEDSQQEALSHSVANSNQIKPKPKKKAKEDLSKETIESPLMSAKNKAKRDQAETFAWKNIGEVFAKKNKANESKQSKDAEAIFGEMIAEELRQFKGRKKAIVRHRIQNVLFEEQMKSFDERPVSFQNAQSTVSSPSSPTEDPYQARNAYGSPIYQAPATQVQPNDQAHWNTSSNTGGAYWTNLLLPDQPKN